MAQTRITDIRTLTVGQQILLNNTVLDITDQARVQGAFGTYQGPPSIGDFEGVRLYLEANDQHRAKTHVITEAGIAHGVHVIFLVE